MPIPPGFLFVFFSRYYENWEEVGRYCAQRRVKWLKDQSWLSSDLRHAHGFV